MCLKAGVRELGSAALGAVCQRLVKRKACEFHQRVGQVKLNETNTKDKEPGKPLVNCLILSLIFTLE